MKVVLPTGFAVALDMTGADGQRANLFNFGFDVSSVEVIETGTDSWRIIYQIEGDAKVASISLSMTGEREPEGGGQFSVSLAIGPYSFIDHLGAEVAAIDLQSGVFWWTRNPDAWFARILEYNVSVAKVQLPISIEGDDVINGTKLGDTIYLGDGNDRSKAWGGRDRIFGGNGNDILDGGAGADRLQGDAGADGFIFRPGYGTDRITDFSVLDDTLLLSKRLWDGQMTVDEVIGAYASFRHGRIELRFGDDVLQLDGIINAGDLADSIQFI